MLVRHRQRARHIERSHVGEKGSTNVVGTGRRASRGGLHELANSDDIALRTSDGVAGGVTVHVLVGAHALLDVTDVHNTTGAVRTPLPSASAHEEDTDQRKKDEDNDRQFDEGHPGLLGVLGVCQCHGFVVCFG